MFYELCADNSNFLGDILPTCNIRRLVKYFERFEEGKVLVSFAMQDGLPGPVVHFYDEITANRYVDVMGGPNASYKPSVSFHWTVPLYFEGNTKAQDYWVAHYDLWEARLQYRQDKINDRVLAAEDKALNAVARCIASLRSKALASTALCSLMRRRMRSLRNTFLAADVVLASMGALGVADREAFKVWRACETDMCLFLEEVPEDEPIVIIDPYTAGEAIGLPELKTVFYYSPDWFNYHRPTMGYRYCYACKWSVFVQQMVKSSLRSSFLPILMEAALWSDMILLEEEITDPKRMAYHERTLPQDAWHYAQDPRYINTLHPSWDWEWTKDYWRFKRALQPALEEPDDTSDEFDL